MPLSPVLPGVSSPPLLRGPHRHENPPDPGLPQAALLPHPRPHPHASSAGVVGADGGRGGPGPPVAGTLHERSEGL